jgi:hypothetical protein
MAEGVGYQTILAVGEESTVNTPVNATQRVRNLEFTADAQYTRLFDESLSGTVAQITPELGVLDIGGTWRAYDTYTLSNLLLKHFFGSLSTGRYTFLDSLVGKSMTWAIDKQVSVWNLSGVKINQLVLTFGAEGATLSGTMIAQGLLYSGGENTAGELAALLPSVAKRCKLAPDLNVRLGVASAALGTPEEISVQSGTLTLTRPMVEQHVSGTRNVLEPAPDNFLQGTVELELSRYSTNQYQTWRAANTRLALRLFFDEENGSGTQEWLIPNLVLDTSPSPVSGPGFVPLSLTGTIAIGQDVYTAATISASTTDDSFNDSANSFPFIYPGATLIASGFVNAANNGVHTVVSRTVSKIIVTTNLTTETAPGSATLISRNPFVQVNEA